MSGKLYLVATPIGNLGDISKRALDTLSDVDFIAAEDTRVTLNLLRHFGIHTPLVSYHEHNSAESGAKIAGRIESGETCALVTDAGMPAISDPGEELVVLCRSRGIEVLVIPGPSAVVSAVALSGISGGRFAFEGFLSINKTAREARLAELISETRAMVFYEAPHKLLRTLKDFYRVFGDRKISISRELTKIHEETRGTTLSESIEYYSENAPRGEFVIVLEGAKKERPAQDIESVIALGKKYIGEGLTTRDAARTASVESGVPKNLIYAALVKDSDTGTRQN